ncbi:MAG: peptide methionine sulfoxide reductase MsrA [Pirellulaceae bacterium]|nr:MAG: peptide methionine sulfoxide reductase MsrA [Pirellulaceae bacterium]GIW95571.1 MAG: peptide methionine sulfoxide reductase MsrA [Pirellulaceae bacterium]GIW96647.1 MAG: peptide methionine sulfoxide reductase MsrA [Pirellulaceae bacterium]
MSDAREPRASKPSQQPFPSSPQRQFAVLAGGCFWCTQAAFQNVPGVLRVVAGYTGGSAETATYEAVCRKDTGHAEAVCIEFDPQRITFQRLLELFFELHDPTQYHRQGADVGPQYRSAIFYATPEQRQQATEVIERLTAEKKFPAPIVTTLEPLESFYPAEQYHQDFARRHPDHPYVRAVIRPKLEKLQHLLTRARPPI